MDSNPRPERVSLTPAPVTWPTKLSGELNYQAITDEEHCKNLAIIASEQDVALEQEYCSRFKDVDHWRFTDLTNQATFWNYYYPLVRAKVGIVNYRKILEIYLDRGLAGDLQAARFVLAELQLSEERRNELNAIKESGEPYRDHILRMTEAVTKALEHKKKKLV